MDIQVISSNEYMNTVGKKGIRTKIARLFILRQSPYRGEHSLQTNTFHYNLMLYDVMMLNSTPI